MTANFLRKVMGKKVKDAKRESQNKAKTSFEVGVAQNQAPIKAQGKKDKEENDTGAKIPFKQVSSKCAIGNIRTMPLRVDKFDQLLSDTGVERGSTTLITGGAGTGKTTFCMQSIYHAAMNGEKCVYLSFEEDPAKIMLHMKKNFGWDFCKLEEKGLIAIIKIDPSKIARMVEGILASESGGLKIKLPTLDLPIKPDRICVDSLSALSIAFEHEDSYRKYIRELFELLESYNSVNLVIGETEQNPKVYSRSGVEEFLADGVVVLYNIRVRGKRRNALEILKMRSGSHVKEIVPYKLGPNGIEILTNQTYEM